MESSQGDARPAEKVSPATLAEDRLLDRLLERLTIRLEQSPSTRSQRENHPTRQNFRSEDKRPAALDDSDASLGNENAESALGIDERTRPQAPPKRVVGVREANLEQYMNRFSANEPINTIDVLVGEDLSVEIQQEEEKRGRKMNGDPRDTADQKTKSDPKTKTNSKHQRLATFGEVLIQRIRIQSDDLLRTISRVTNYSWGQAPLTFVRPFTYFIQHFDALK